MTEQQTNTQNWLDMESTELVVSTGERLPALKFETENTIEEVDIDFTNPFNKYTDTSDAKKSVVKAMVPVTHKGVKKLWWLNKKNPAYQEIIKAGKAKQTHFKIMRTGTAANTRYVFVK